MGEERADEKTSGSQKQQATADNEEERVVPMRLQRFLARAGVSSRRGAENLMTAGRVTVNGEVVSELGSKVDPLVDHVEVDGVPVVLGAGAVTIMLNKPAGVITTMARQSAKPIVADLVPLDKYPGLYPLGRLDADTTGLLLFSTDGKLGNALLHPRHHVLKTYVALVKGRPTPEALDHLRNGIELDDGPCQPATVELLERDEAKRARALFNVELPRRVNAADKRDTRTSVVRIGLREGRYHQVKRMLYAVGTPVIALHRESMGSLSLGDLPVGAWRQLTADEVKALKKDADYDEQDNGGNVHPSSC